MNAGIKVARYATAEKKQVAEIRLLWGDTLDKNLAVAHIITNL
jgi:hypothetical protein